MGARLIVLLFILILSGTGIKAQDKISFADLDRSSLELYQQGRWKELRDIGLKGIDTGFDYFYLRMRVGIACYELKNYEKASKHFARALEFNENDPAALEYLYFSLKFCGREKEAVFLAAEMPAETRKSIGAPGKNGLTGIFAGAGRIGITEPDSLLGRMPEGPYSYSYLLKDYNYYSGGFSINSGGKLNFKVSINSMSFNAVQEGRIKEPAQPVPMQFNWEWENSQTGFYLAADYLVRSGLYFNAAAHFIDGKYSYMRYLGRQGMGQDLFGETILRYSDQVFDAGLSLRKNNISAGLNISYSDLGENKRLQPGLSAIWYPLGNLNLYAQGRADALIPLGRSGNMEWVYKATAGAKIFSHLWLEINSAMGRMEGWAEEAASIVFNNQDPLTRRVGAAVIIPGIFKKLTLTISYQYQLRQHSWEVYDGNILQELQTSEYFTNSLIGGVIWNF